MRSYEFQYDPRLGIRLPVLHLDWEEYSVQEQTDILQEWDTIRGAIPNRVIALEQQINAKQAELNVEESFPRSCELNYRIAELASIINDLHLWYRVNQELGSRLHQ